MPAAAMSAILTSCAQLGHFKNSMDAAHEIAVEVWNNYIARPNNNPEKHKFSFKDLEKAINLKLKESVEKN